MRKNCPKRIWIACLGVGLWQCISPAAAQVQRRDPQRIPPALTEIERIGRSPLWVRARIDSVDPPLVRYTILHVIYGDCQDETITLDHSSEPPRPNLDPRVPGRQVVLELRPAPWAAVAGGVVNYRALGTSYVPDRSEEAIVQAITDGSAFEVRKSVRISDQIGETQLIVRAQLEQIGQGEFKWKIIRFLKGIAPTQTLILDDQLFRNRARTIVGDAARKQIASRASEPAGPATRTAATPDPSSLVDAETKRLINAELPVSMEAILFLNDVQVQPDSVRGRLQYRSYNNGQQILDKLEVTIFDEMIGR